jgi:spore coat protein U-like protein
MKSNQRRNGNAKVLRLAVASVFALVGATSHAAGTAQQNLAVTATVPTNCLISTGALGFGNYDPISANASTDRDAEGSVTVTCTLGATAKIMLNQGLNGTGTDASPVRRMSDGAGHFLPYNLYQEAARTTLWGNTDGTHVLGTADGTAHSVQVYGRIPSGYNAYQGSYTDTVIATVSF